VENQAHLSTWYTYQKAWSDVSSAERQGLLVDSVTDGCVYTDPSTQCNGRAELMAFIEQFRQSMPGTSFKNNTFTHHHAQSLATWVLQDAQGNELQPGMSYARFGEDGRLTLVTGFF
jgi:hypothetical protein